MKDILYAHEIEESVKKNNITHWFPFRCYICNEQYGFYFENGIVTFDGACSCNAIFGPRQTTFQEIAEIYNKNINENFRKEILEYFKIGDIL